MKITLELDIYIMILVTVFKFVECYSVQFFCVYLLLADPFFIVVINKDTNTDKKNK